MPLEGSTSRLPAFLAGASAWRAGLPSFLRPGPTGAPAAPGAVPRLLRDTWSASRPVAPVGAPATLPGRVTWRGDFSTGDASQWAGVQAKPGAITIYRDPASGRNVARFEVGPGDDPIRSGGERAEVSGAKGAVMEKTGTEAWYGWSTRFPAGFVPTPRSYHNIFTQWHGSSGGGAPNVSLTVNTTGPRPMLCLQLDGADTHHTLEHRIDLLPLELGKWYDFKLHVRWAEDKTGLIELWVDGKPLVTGLRTPTLFHGEDTYVKQGFYRGNHDRRTVVEHTGMQRSVP